MKPLLEDVRNYIKKEGLLSRVNLISEELQSIWDKTRDNNKHRLSLLKSDNTDEDTLRRIQNIIASLDKNSSGSFRKDLHRQVTTEVDQLVTISDEIIERFESETKEYDELEYCFNDIHSLMRRFVRNKDKLEQLHSNINVLMKNHFRNIDIGPIPTLNRITFRDIQTYSPETFRKKSQKSLEEISNWFKRILRGAPVRNVAANQKKKHSKELDIDQINKRIKRKFGEIAVEFSIRVDKACDSILKKHIERRDDLSKSKKEKDKRIRDLKEKMHQLDKFKSTYKKTLNTVRSLEKSLGG